MLGIPTKDRQQLCSTLLEKISKIDNGFRISNQFLVENAETSFKDMFLISGMPLGGIGKAKTNQMFRRMPEIFSGLISLDQRNLFGFVVWSFIEFFLEEKIFPSPFVIFFDDFQVWDDLIRYFTDNFSHNFYFTSFLIKVGWIGHRFLLSFHFFSPIF